MYVSNNQSCNLRGGDLNSSSNLLYKTWAATSSTSYTFTSDYDLVVISCSFTDGVSDPSSNCSITFSGSGTTLLSDKRKYSHDNNAVKMTNVIINVKKNSTVKIAGSWQSMVNIYGFNK